MGMKENNEEAILEREEKDGPEGTMKLNKTSSDAATASVNTKRNGNYDLSSIDETEYGSPLKTMMIRSSVGEERTSSSKSRFRSSLTILSIERPCPKKLFRFRRDIEREGPNFFSNLYETYKIRYERYKNMIEHADFHPLKDFRHLVAETAHSAEESAIKSAQNMYETFVQPGSPVD